MMVGCGATVLVGAISRSGCSAAVTPAPLTWLRKLPATQPDPMPGILSGCQRYPPWAIGEPVTVPRVPAVISPMIVLVVPAPVRTFTLTVAWTVDPTGNAPATATRTPMPIAGAFPVGSTVQAPVNVSVRTG